MWRNTMGKVIVTGEDLTLEELVKVCREYEFVELAEEAKKRCSHQEKL